MAWANDRAGIVWREANTDVWFATVSPTGAFIEAPMRIAMGLSNLGCPAITWTGNTRFIIAMSFGALNQQDIETTTFAGTTTTAFVNVTNDTAASLTPRLAAGSMDSVLLAWSKPQGNRTDVLVRPLTTLGQATGAITTASAQQSTNQGQSIATMANSFWVAWSGQPNLFSRAFTLAGTPSANEIGFGALPPTARSASLRRARRSSWCGRRSVALI